MTSSLYVPGTLADLDRVIVDVGTGFYVEKVVTSKQSCPSFSDCMLIEAGTECGGRFELLYGKS